jgi:carbamoyltransferase
MDLAASVQAVVEDVILKLTAALHRETQIDNLCLAGGVALNCVANGKIRRQGSFKRLWVQPAAGDAGGALGAALAAYHVWAGKGRISTANGAADAMHGCLVGPSYSDAAIEQALTTAGARFRSMPDEDGLLDEVAGDLEAGRAVGWFQGRMEFGPRALGARSILADPRSAEMQRTLNLKVKFRESFRPFAPAVLEEPASEWFDLDDSSPYMALVASVAENMKVHGPDSALVGLARLNEARSVIPAVTHVDGSARIQTVSAATNRLFHALLTRFQRRTGCPVLVNTSFNVRGEPIVCTPADAFRCFMGTDIETLAIGSFLLRKEEQTARSSQEYRFAFAPD